MTTPTELKRIRVALGTVTENEWQHKAERNLNPASSISYLRSWTSRNLKPVRAGLEKAWARIARATTKEGASSVAIREAYTEFVKEDLEQVWIDSFHSAGRHMARYIKSDIADGWPWQGGIKGLTAWIKERSGELIKDLTQREKESIRAQLYYWTHVEIITVDQIARNLREYVGLLQRQWKTLEKYHQQLIKDGVAPDRIKRLMGRQKKRMHGVRTRTIARTEVSEAWNRGQIESVRQGIEAGQITGEPWKRWWTSDPCPICRPLDGKTAKMEEPFPGVGLTPPVHPNCMCVVQYFTK